MKNQLYLGTAYYPEHWDESEWESSISLMQEAGLNFVRLVEFAWSRLEPEDGVYQFDWLDRVVALCAQYNIEVMLCTPTAAPPPWLLKKHPDVVPVKIDGQSMSPTSTRHCYCPNNLVYREYSRKIATAMVEHYKDHESVVAWQIDNEFGIMLDQSETCYCEDCAREFQHWVEDRYVTLDGLNEAWGTVFSSNTYTAWDEILPPNRTTMVSPDPAHALDYWRFISDSYIAFQKIQIDALRAGAPHQKITHNLAGDRIDYFKLFKDLDYAGWDNYPSFKTPSAPHLASANHDACRGYKQQNFWILEQQTKGQMHFLDPGYIRLYTYQGIAHGADLVCYFRWRLCRFGREQLRSGIVDWDGGTNRRYREVQQTGKELERLSSEIHGSTCRADVGIIMSFDVRWAFSIQNAYLYMGTPFHYPQQMADLFYRPLFDRNISTDILDLQANTLEDYKLILAPALYLLTADAVERLKAYVQAGGVLVLSVPAGYKDWNNNMIEDALPGALSELLGFTIEESNSFHHVPDLNRVMLQIPGEAEIETSATVWGEVLRPTTAEVLGRYSTNFFAGSAAVTCNHFGKGKVLYIGSVLSPEAHGKLVDWAVLLAAGVAALESPDNVEVSFRYKGPHKYIFILNHNKEEKVLNIGCGYHDLLTGIDSDQPIQIDGLGVRVVRVFAENGWKE